MPSDILLHRFFMLAIAYPAVALLSGVLLWFVSKKDAWQFKVVAVLLMYGGIRYLMFGYPSYETFSHLFTDPKYCESLHRSKLGKLIPDSQNENVSKRRHPAYGVLGYAGPYDFCDSYVMPWYIEQAISEGIFSSPELVSFRKTAKDIGLQLYSHTYHRQLDSIAWRDIASSQKELLKLATTDLETLVDEVVRTRTVVEILEYIEEQNQKPTVIDGWMGTRVWDAELDIFHEKRAAAVSALARHMSENGLDRDAAALRAATIADTLGYMLISRTTRIRLDDLRQGKDGLYESPELRALENVSTQIGFTLSRWYGRGSGWKDVHSTMKRVRLLAGAELHTPLEGTSIGELALADIEDFIASRNSDEFVINGKEGRPVGPELMDEFYRVREGAIMDMKEDMIRRGLDADAAAQRATILLDTYSYLLIQGM